ncbi:hypothetical protein SAMN04489834_2511 [Microterricola viridarii]|uniref:YCII-related domain-containing protein n=1 Tax=Microterricola viridarii TaxID=412690 RepID=A0A1H1WE66_9MICO|nr:hypothetical protein SAMN04489834_2511 [Microterricola viridarii]
MSKFAVIYTSPETVESAVSNLSPEEEAASTQAWIEWSSRVGKNLADFGAPLGQGKHVAPSGVTDAPVGVSGYSFIEADSLDEAVAMMDGHPHLMTPGATIQVYEVLAVPGM